MLTHFCLKLLKSVPWRFINVYTYYVPRSSIKMVRFYEMGDTCSYCRVDEVVVAEFGVVHNC